MIKIKVSINYRLINHYWELFLKRLILRRAYDGYYLWCWKGSVEPFSYEDFRKFEFWRVAISFDLYLFYFKGVHRNRIGYISWSFWLIVFDWVNLKIKK